MKDIILNPHSTIKDVINALNKGAIKIAIVLDKRDGSKRLPNKNILYLCNKPLIAWSIEAAKKSPYIKEIVVTSDSDKILDIAKKYRVKALKRPKYLVTDTAKSEEAILHVIENYPEFEYIVLLQPTSPLRIEKHIDKAIELLKKKNADGIISVCQVDHSPLWSNTLPENLDMSNFLRDEIKGKRSQDLPKYYRLNGAIYICKTKRLIKENSFFIKDKIFAYVMENIDSVDIDTKLDFLFAKFILKEIYGKACD